MAYRFSDTGKWQDEWFVDLTADQKLMFLYFCDNCDIAGFYELSTRRMVFDLGMTEDEVKGAFKGLTKSYILSNDKRVIFIKRFIKHQKNLPLNPLNKSHIGIFKRFENYRDRFTINLIELVNKDVKFMGLSNPTGNGIGNGKGIGKDKDGISFENFWDLYGKKIGDKDKVRAKWDKLKIEVQTKILKVLPQWKLQFTDRQFQPYPATFLNQKRWEDDLSEQGTIIKLKYPNEFSAKFEATLQPHEYAAYWAHLRSLGWRRPSDGRGGYKEWTKSA